MRPKLNNPYPMLGGGGGTITVKILGLVYLLVHSVCSTLLNSSGIAGIYPRRCLGKSGLCRSQIRGLRMSHRLFLGCTRGPTPGTLIDQKGFYILCLLEPTFNKQQQLTKGAPDQEHGLFMELLEAPSSPSWKT